MTLRHNFVMGISAIVAGLAGWYIVHGLLGGDSAVSVLVSLTSTASSFAFVGGLLRNAQGLCTGLSLSATFSYLNLFHCYADHLLSWKLKWMAAMLMAPIMCYIAGRLLHKPLATPLRRLWHRLS